ncbi:hypothetical protein H5410_050888 [Solanum commersonii]|uniref:Uncharacterized protein n=1 Tax=Solanum commersonii TaxID=4109 RepID=A0A9J5WYE1_SOLCO|nr:hypothetical protein H5410_050888 [Solanum commersonii]
MSLEFEMLDITIPRQQSISRKCQIPKVPLFMRIDNQKSDDYDPKISSLEEIIREIDDFKSCYLEEFMNKYNNYEIARMTLLGACFIQNDTEISTWSTPNSATKQSSTIKHLGIAVYLVTKRDLYLLENRGIHFCPSGIDSLKGVRFASHYYYGKLKLPCWYVSTYTEVFFMKMIAYELCPNGPIDSVFVSYINFMKSLVISPNDVKELREEKIIFNTLGSDDEVVQVYKGLKTYGTDDRLLFKNVKRNIQ